MSSEVWKKLDAINVNEATEQKGKFTYLSWADAWTELMKVYPDSTHDMLEDVHYSDGTMEVRSSVTVDGRTLKCFLPVIDHRNKAISNPNAFDINKNRMRCLAKNIALFGLGLYIFRGEDLPQEPPRETFKPEQREQLISLLAAKDGWGLKKLGQEVGNDIMSDLFSSFAKGEVSKTKGLVRELVGAANSELKKVLGWLGDEAETGTASSIQEGLDEMGDIERGFVLAGLTEVQKIQLTDMGVVLK